MGDFFILFFILMYVTRVVRQQIPKQGYRSDRSAFDRVIAHRLPPENQIPFLRASGSLTGGTIMDMDMRSAIRNGVIQRHVTLKSLVQISSLSNVDGNPTAVLGLFGINVIAWQRPERGVNGMNLVLIPVAGLPEPTDG